MTARGPTPAIAAVKEELRLLLGGEAVAAGALDAGITAAYSYPGTPATEVFELVEREARDGRVQAHWCANEKVAMEAALGTSYAGRRALVAFKHVGLNVAADAFVSSALTGVDGGLVVAVADDPGMHSSQNEQDSRWLADFAHLPCLEPSSVAQAYEMTREAFDLSERLGLPVMLRLVTRLAHCRSVLPPPQVPPRAQNALRPSTRGLDWVLLPSVARGAFARLAERQGELLAWSEASRWNALSLPAAAASRSASGPGAGARAPLGVIAAGVAVNELLENLPDAAAPWPSLRIGAYPAPVEPIRKLAQACVEVLVLEDGYPYLERALNGLLGLAGTRVRGRLDGTLPRTGELKGDKVRAALGLLPHPRPFAVPQGLPARPPCLCDGCPHFDSIALVQAIFEDHPATRVFGDIGCYTLSAYPPHQASHATLCMGASIGMALGAARAGMHPVLAMIGDSTFAHSGMPALLDAARQDVPVTVLILDNGAVAMTGCQPASATGEDLLGVVRGLGVSPERSHLLHAHPRDHAANLEVLRREVAHPGLSVVILNRPCVLIPALPLNA